MIQVKNISKEFVSAKKYPGLKGAIKGLFSNEKVSKQAVKDISFDIADGEIVGYIGSNGAGKSTTIKMMTGILAPTSGEVIVNGINPRKERSKNAKKIGVVFGQRTQLWWDLPVQETFTILKEIYEVSDEDFVERIDYLDHVLGINEFMDRPVRTLSLGQRMRADIAAALIHNPPVLFLDEPTIGLDLVVKDNIRQAIKDINKKYNTTVILTTHDIEDIEELCERIIIIDDGSKIYDGSLENLKKSYGTTASVIFEPKKMDDMDNLSISDMLGLADDECSMELDYENNLLTVVYDKRKVQAPQIVNIMMEATTVLDFKTEDTKLAEIVKAIYLDELDNISSGGTFAC